MRAEGVTLAQFPRPRGPSPDPVRHAPVAPAPDVSDTGPEPPTATRGFLFADLRDYTSYVEIHGDAEAAELLDRYRAIVRGVVLRMGGAEIKTEGDSFFVAFDSASAAVRGGWEILAAARTSDPERPIRVGVGVHAGETIQTAEGFVGSAVNLAARVCARAAAGELLVTDTVRGLTRTSLPLGFEPLGPQRLKGIAEPVPLYRITPRASEAASGHRIAPDGRRLRLARLSAGALVLILGATVFLALGARPSTGGIPKTTPAVTDLAIASALVSAAPTVAASGQGQSASVSETSPAASADSFPNAAEKRLLAKIDSVPGGLAATCQRGSYLTVASEDQAGRAPIASLACAPASDAGASVVKVRQFASSTIGVGFVQGYIALIVWPMNVSPKSPVVIPRGDCAKSPRANGTWSSAAQPAGEIVCYTEGDTGDAILTWTYDADAIIVDARNPRGDAQALYAYFKRIAPFIGG